jgi:toluene monooxygenase system ferredoxin subunit
VILRSAVASSHKEPRRRWVESGHVLDLCSGSRDSALSGVGCRQRFLKVAFTRVCGLQELAEGQMESYFVDDIEVLLVCSTAGLHAFDGTCPHEEFPLVDGLFDGSTIVCSGHMWTFNAVTGQGVNPPGCRLTEYPIKIEDDGIYVDVDAVLPLTQSR